MVTAITQGVKISVDTIYQDEHSSPESGHFMFAYRIHIENLTDYEIQLMRRQWFIFDSNGTVREVEGEGVVGVQPVIAPGDSYSYVSGSNLKTDIGSMRGRYLMHRSVDDTEFMVDIPEFELIVPFRLNYSSLMDASFIRDLYIPIQPTVKSYGAVTYQEFLPHLQLQPFIYCYWQLKTSEKLAQPFNYRVVADGCIDIFFELEKPSENFVMGFCKKYTEFELTAEFNYIGIRFLPTMFPQLFGVDASSISNKAEELNLVVPKVASFIQTYFNTSVDINFAVKLLDEFLLEQVSAMVFQNDARLYNAISLIMKNLGVINIDEIDTGLSQRQLRRLFDFYIGDSMKTFSKVVRFQNILRAKPSTQSLKNNKLFFNSGFFDQSHFIKDFKHFYGVTPSKAFGR